MKIKLFILIALMSITQNSEARKLYLFGFYTGLHECKASGCSSGFPGSMSGNYETTFISIGPCPTSFSHTDLHSGYSVSCNTVKEIAYGSGSNAAETGLLRFNEANNSVEVVKDGVSISCYDGVSSLLQLKDAQDAAILNNQSLDQCSRSSTATSETFSRGGQSITLEQAP